MALYATVDGVQAVLPSDVSLDASTTLRPTRTEVNTWCNRTTSRVDVALRQGGETAPLTDPDDVAAATDLCIHKVAYDVLVVRVGVTESKGAAWLEWGKIFEEALKLMAAGKWSPGYTDASKPWSATMDAETTPSDEGLKPLVTKEMDF